MVKVVSEASSVSDLAGGFDGSPDEAPVTRTSPSAQIV